MIDFIIKLKSVWCYF